MTEESSLGIRRGDARDVDLLVDLGVTTFTETFAHLNSAEDMNAYLSSAFDRDRVAAEVADPSSTFFVAEVDGVGAGYAKLYAGEAETCVEGPKPIELVRLYVLQAWLGRRVGAALMEACLEHARREGYETLWLGVWEHNERAKAFYRKWGFREVGSHLFLLGSDAQTDLIMERSLV